MKLIVDNESLIQRVIQEVLTIGAYDSCAASNGDEGLREFYEHYPDLVITDARVPVIDGYEFSRLVREVSDVPIILLTRAGYLSSEVPVSDIVDKG